MVEASSLENAAFNIALKQAETMGIEPSEGEMRAQTAQNLERLKADPGEWQFKEGGTAAARSKGQDLTGTWTLEGDTLTLDLPALGKPHQFRVVDGGLIGLSTRKDGREVLFKRTGP